MALQPSQPSSSHLRLVKNQAENADKLATKKQSDQTLINERAETKSLAPKYAPIVFLMIAWLAEIILLWSVLPGQWLHSVLGAELPVYSGFGLVITTMVVFLSHVKNHHQALQQFAHTFETLKIEHQTQQEQADQRQDETFKQTQLLEDQLQTLSSQLIKLQDIPNHIEPNRELIQQQIGAITQTVAYTAQCLIGLSKLNRDLQSDNRLSSESLEGIVDKADTIAAMSINLEENVTQAESAIEQMSASLQDVSNFALRSSHKANDMEGSLNQTQLTLKELQEAAAEINSVVDIIKSIASQTNLLALNATIEAASAGPAGKGFAVVANEVKALATKSAESTKSIQEQVSQIQSRIDAVTEQIDGTTQGLGDILEATNAIAGAIGEQQILANEAQTNIQVSTKFAKEIAEFNKNSAEALLDITILNQQSASQYEKVTLQLTNLGSATQQIHQTGQTISHEVETIYSKFQQ